MSIRVKLINADNVLKETIETSNENYDGIFIDWIPANTKNIKNAEKIITQTNILEEEIKKGIKIILFDRYQSITQKEVNWIKKYKNVILCEPALITRAGFTYMPFWTKILSINELRIDDHKRDITFLHCGEISSKMKSFEKFYNLYKSCFGDAVLAYNTEDQNQIEIFEQNFSYLNHSTKTYQDAKYTIAFGSEKDYKVGYLDYHIFEALEMNCVPFIPDDHRYYHALPHLTPKSVSWYTMEYENVYIGLLLDFYNAIKKYYPEMDVNSVKNQIDKLLE
jgi:hypothetical protein